MQPTSLTTCLPLLLLNEKGRSVWSYQGKREVGLVVPGKKEGRSGRTREKGSSIWSYQGKRKVGLVVPGKKEGRSGRTREKGRSVWSYQGKRKVGLVVPGKKEGRSGRTREKGRSVWSYQGKRKVGLVVPGKKEGRSGRTREIQMHDKKKPKLAKILHEELLKKKMKYNYFELKVNDFEEKNESWILINNVIFLLVCICQLF